MNATTNHCPLLTFTRRGTLRHGPASNALMIDPAMRAHAANVLATGCPHALAAIAARTGAAIACEVRS